MVNKDAIQSAIAAHGAWKSRLVGAIDTGKFDVPVSTVEQDNQCPFGKWLYGSELAAQDRQTEHYRGVQQLHARFHEHAAKVLKLAISGQKEAAGKAIGMGGEYSKASTDLTLALVAWRNSA